MHCLLKSVSALDAMDPFQMTSRLDNVKKMRHDKLKLRVSVLSAHKHKARPLRKFRHGVARERLKSEFKKSRIYRQIGSFWVAQKRVHFYRDICVGF